VNVLASFAAAHSQARVQLDELQVDDQSLSTRLYDGVHKAVELIRDAQDIPRRRFVIVFSDGEDGGSQHALDEIIEYSRGDEVRPRTLVFTIGYARFGGNGLDLMRRLARETGASDFRATSTIDLASFYNEVWRQMKQSYVVRYPWSMDGERHTVEVCVEGQCDTRSAAYADIRGPLWPWLAGAGGVTLLAAAALLVRRRDTLGRIVFVGGARDGEVVVLRGSKARLGALADNEIVIPSTHASRYHARIVKSGRRVEIEDLNSSNGTFVNGMRVRSGPLRSGDKIRIADVDLVYER
jgi:FHA domain